MFLVKKEFETIATTFTISEAVAVGERHRTPVQIFDQTSSKLLYEWTPQDGLRQFLVD